MEQQHPVVISVCGKPGTDATYIEFVEALHKTGFFERFEVAQIALPVHENKRTPTFFEQRFGAKT